MYWVAGVENMLAHSSSVGGLFSFSTCLSEVPEVPSLSASRVRLILLLNSAATAVANSLIASVAAMESVYCGGLSVDSRALQKNN